MGSSSTISLLDVFIIAIVGLGAYQLYQNISHSYAAHYAYAGKKKKGKKGGKYGGKGGKGGGGGQKTTSVDQCAQTADRGCCQKGFDRGGQLKDYEAKNCAKCGDIECH
jgi:hypothetical protein